MSTYNDPHGHCTTTVHHTGTPAGTLSKLDSRDTYVTGTSKTTAMLYLTDIYGYKYTNHQLLADTYASALGITVYIPDFLEGSEFPRDGPKPDWNEFVRFNSKSKRTPQYESFAKALKSEGYSAIFVVGICWGGWGTLQLGADSSVVTAVVVAHPSALELPRDVENLSVPSFFVIPYTDHQLTVEKRRLVDDILNKNALERKLFGKLTVYPGVSHGFSVRGPEEGYIGDVAKEAAEDVIHFFKKYVK